MKIMEVTVLDSILYKSHWIRLREQEWKQRAGRG